MQIVRTWMFALVAGSLLGFAGHSAAAQPAGLNPERDCQVVRACNFGRGGAYRGCLSSYTCRVCRFVRSPCYVDGARRVCSRMRCTWGG